MTEDTGCQTPSAALGSSCLQIFAEGYITAKGMCRRCAEVAMPALDEASPEPSTWHPNIAVYVGTAQ
ncbi:hypothetical protein [Nonomuraea longicatena]|uniref:Uncharacterized protein n=1 Tax=Nonomuraea longicatena TaxID=83682 RepID=A0ABP4BR38_9ACTN